MAYSRRNNYKTMREKNQRAWKRAKAIVLIGTIFLIVLGIKNRVLVAEFFMSVFS